MIPTAPPAIIFVNNDLSPNVQAALVRQLFIDEVMDGYEFDQRVIVDPNYPTEVHGNNLRILVIRSFRDLTNRTLADIAIFVKMGMAAIELNKFGPPRKTLPVDRLYYSAFFQPNFQVRDEGGRDDNTICSNGISIVSIFGDAGNENDLDDIIYPNNDGYYHP